MRTVLAAVILAGAAVLAAQPAPRSSGDLQALQARADAGERVRVIVGVRSSAPLARETAGPSAADVVMMAAARNEVLTGLAAYAPRDIKAFDYIPYFAADVDAAGLRHLASRTDVVSIEEDHIGRADLMDSAPIVEAPQAWSAGYMGAGWNVAILDTGVQRTHPFVRWGIASEACYSSTTSRSSNACIGGVNSTDPGSAWPCAVSGCEHGTHVAGIAAGTGGPGGINGIAPQAGIIAIQIFSIFSGADCGGAASCPRYWESDLVLGMNRVYALRNTFQIASVNLSLGDGTQNNTYCDTGHGSLASIVNTLRSAGIATVVAAGNDGYYSGISAPGCLSGAVSVGATTKWDAITSFSNTGAILKLLAPGQDIYSSLTWSTYGYKSGTSMATPHVTGAWAILKQKKPYGTVPDLLQTLQDTGVPLTDPLSGRAFPRIRVKAALDRLKIAMMALDGPTGTVKQPFTIAGWALDQEDPSGSGIDLIHVYAYPDPGSGKPPVFVGATSSFTARPDVGGIYGAQFTNSGYNVAVRGLLPGTYQFVVYARSATTRTFRISRSVVLNVLANPIVAIDAPGAATGLPMLVAGWTADLAAASGAGTDVVHVYAYPNPGSGQTPIFLGAASVGTARGDVAAVYGTQFTNVGYQLVAPALRAGVYRIVVYARSTLTGTFNSAYVDVTVQAPAEQMLLLSPAAGATVLQPFDLTGWAVDLGYVCTNPSVGCGAGVDAIHVWAYPETGNPIFVGAAGYGFAQPDLQRVFGTQFGNSGFLLTVRGLRTGRYTLVVYAHSVVSGSFTNVRTLPLTIKTNPQMSFDVPANGEVLPQTFVAGGWAAELAASSGTGIDAIHMWGIPVGGGTARFLGSLPYGGARPDVGAIFGTQFTNSAFGVRVFDMPVGTWDLAVYGHSTVDDAFTMTRAARVTVRRTDVAWSPGTNMTTTHARQSLFLLPNGKVLAVGDKELVEGSPASVGELYDPATGNWSATGPMPGIFSDSSIVQLADGRVMVTGGWIKYASYANHIVLNATAIYDWQTNTWRASGSMNAKRLWHTATLLADGRVMVTGGFNDGPLYDHGTYLADYEIWDPTTEQWTYKGLAFKQVYSNGYVSQVPKFNHAATRLRDGRVLVTGGETDGGFWWGNRPAIYDPSTDVWTTLDVDPGTPRASHCAMLLPDGRVLVAGGYARGMDASSYPSHIGTGTTIAAAEIFDPATNTFTPVAAGMTPRRDFAMVQLIDGEILMIGGWTDSGPTAATQMLKLSSTNEWYSSRSLVQVPRSFLGAIVMPDARVIVTGGIGCCTVGTGPAMATTDIGVLAGAPQ